MEEDVGEPLVDDEDERATGEFVIVESFLVAWFARRRATAWYCLLFWLVLRLLHGSDIRPEARDSKPGAYRGAGNPRVCDCWPGASGGSNEECVRRWSWEGGAVYVGVSETYEGAALRRDIESGSRRE